MVAAKVIHHVVVADGKASAAPNPLQCVGTTSGSPSQRRGASGTITAAGSQATTSPATVRNVRVMAVPL